MFESHSKYLRNWHWANILLFGPMKWWRWSWRMHKLNSNTPSSVFTSVMIPKYHRSSYLLATYLDGIKYSLNIWQYILYSGDNIFLKLYFRVGSSSLLILVASKFPKQSKSLMLWKLWFMEVFVHLQSVLQGQNVSDLQPLEIK